MDKKQVYPVAIFTASGLFIFTMAQVLRSAGATNRHRFGGQTQVLLIVCSVVLAIGAGMYLVTYLRGGKLD